MEKVEMKRIKFYLDKIKFMTIFAWERDWMLFSEEWKLTYAEMQDARGRGYEIYREAILRLMKEVEK
jgi:hypothetical protein